MFDLVVQSAEELVGEPAAAHVAGGEDLLAQVVEFLVRGDDGHSFVVRRERAAHVETEHGLVHGDEGQRGQRIQHQQQSPGVEDEVTRKQGDFQASVLGGWRAPQPGDARDVQVQTFQRLFSSALEDIIATCFEIDEALWGDVSKTRIIKDNGAPRKYTYVPAKDIDGNHQVDVTYGAIAGLDPNRGLVFVLQALAGGLISKQTAMKSLPVDMNPLAETRKIQMEQMDGSIAASIAQLPMAIPQMAAGGQDPRELVMQIAELQDLISKGKSPAEAISKVFAPKQPPEAEGAAEQPSPLEQAQGAGGGPAGLPGAGGGGAADMLMSLAGMTPGGKPNMQSNVSRMQPAAGQ